MTREQFEAVAKLIRSGDSPSRTAARLVLVDGLIPAEAARQAGCTPQAASNALRAYRDAAALIEAAWGIGPT